MSTLYGKVDLGNPERQEFFGETRKQLQQYINLQDAEKAAEEKAMQDAGDVPPLSSVGLYQRDFDAAQQMANILKDKKSDMLGTEEGRRQYQRGLDELSGFLSDRKTYYNTTHPILVQNTSLKKAGKNPNEWATNGLMDGRTLEQYIAKTAELDTNRFNVKFDNGSFVLADQDGDHASNDPSLMDLSWFDEDKYLVQTPPVRPEDFYNVNRLNNESRFKNRAEVVSWAESTIMTDPSDLKIRDAVRWFVNSDENQNADRPLTEKEVMDTPERRIEAAAAYAEASVPKNWSPFKKEDKKGSASEKRKDALDSLADGIKPGMSVTTMTAEGEGSVQATYAPLDSTGVYVGWSDGLDGDSAKYKVDGIYLDDESNPIIALITSKGTEYVPVGLNDDLYNEIEAKMADKYGKGALRKLLIQMD